MRQRRKVSFPQTQLGNVGKTMKDPVFPQQALYVLNHLLKTANIFPFWFEMIVQEL